MLKLCLSAQVSATFLDFQTVPLPEFDDEGMSAELYLKKTMTGKIVSWQGEMTNHRFKQLENTREADRLAARGIISIARTPAVSEKL